MIVLHVDSGREWRGGQHQVLLLALGQQRAAMKPTIVCPEHSPLAARARAAGVPVKCCQLHGDINPRAILQLAAIIKRLKPTIVHSHTSHALTTAALALTRFPGIPHVHTRRVDFPLRSAASRMKYRFGANHLIAISNAVREVLLHNGIPAERVSVVYSGIDFAALQARTTGVNLRPALGLGPEHLVVGTVAQLTDHKGYRYLIEAARLVVDKLPNSRFLIIGAGPLGPSLQEQTRMLQLDREVQFLGFRQDVPDLLNILDLFVLPSHLEGLCTSLLDAMAFRLPIVAASTGGIPEAVIDGENGLLAPPREAGPLAAAIISLLQSPERRRSMGESGYRMVHDRFSNVRTVTETTAIYQRVLQPHDCSPT